MTFVFIGYSSVQKGYILFNFDTKTFFVNRDVVFHESVFPFHFVHKSDNIMFPSQFSFCDDDLLVLLLVAHPSTSQSTTSLSPTVQTSLNQSSTSQLPTISPIG